jgi:hypothetical protein
MISATPPTGPGAGIGVQFGACVPPNFAAHFGQVQVASFGMAATLYKPVPFANRPSA